METLIRYYCNFTEKELKEKDINETYALYHEALYIEERLGLIFQNAVARAFSGEEK